ncbi:hypothetical protein GCM10009742_78470 [Kribbella karoonensis]|uniref:Uncharacterized protein n=1 Tax=Kribbella karoonensis TaxID=324851 RepID=A0ABN2ER88_9ACTN
MIADTADAKPGVAACTGGPDGISAAARTAAPVTRASTNFFICVLTQAGSYSACLITHQRRTLAPQEAHRKRASCSRYDFVLEKPFHLAR